MTKEFIDSIVKQLKEYVDAKLRGWGLSDEEKSLVAFEQKHMPYTQYSGNQSIDHVLFRKFLRMFNPDAIREAAKVDVDKKQDKVDEGLQTQEKTIVGAINEVFDSLSDGYVYDSDKNSFAAGNASDATGQNAFAEGWGTLASGNQSHAEGNQTIASAPQAHAEGWGTQAANKCAHAEGDETIASGLYSHAEGEKSQAVENYAHAEGKGSIAAGAQSHAEGNSTKTFGNQSHAEGYCSQAIGNGAHAEGDSTVAYAPYSHAEGANSKAGYYVEKPTANSLTEPSNKGDDRGGYAHAEGAATLAIGKASHAEGFKTFAGGLASHAEGYITKASGDYSHAEGRTTEANGDYSHTEGVNGYAYGDYSHVENANNTAYGKYSHVGGTYNVAKNEAQHVCGKYAIIDTTGKAIMQVGVGVSVDNRQDGFVVYTDGTFKFGADTGDYVIISVEDLKAMLANKATIIYYHVKSEDAQRDYAFVSIKYLTEAVLLEETYDSIELDSKIRKIWREAFKQSNISSVTIPNEIFVIETEAFASCYNLKQITWSNNIRTIDTQAFYNCVSLKSLPSIPSLKTIGEQAFEGCTSLSNVTIEDKCASVGRQAFYNCTSLESITFGAATTLILGGCINGCTSLKTITCKAVTPPELYAGNYLTNVEAVYVPAESVEAYKAAPQWSSYANVIIPIPIS